MANYWEVYTSMHSDAVLPVTVDVTAFGLSSPSIAATVCDDITDPDNISDVSGTVLSGAATISTTSLTTRILTPAAAGKRYKIITTITDGSSTHVVSSFVEVPD